MLYDKDIREPLFEYFEERQGKIRIFEEKMIGSARADVVIVTENELWGVEIKSDADTYTRLAGQVKNYDRYYDRNWLVVGSKHGVHASEHVPEYWGILSVEVIEDKIDFYLIREPQKNPNVQLDFKLSVLWRPELAHIQEIKGLHKYTTKSKQFVRDYILQQVLPEELEILISEELFERDYSKIAEQINSYRQSKGQKKRRAQKTRKIIKHRKKLYNVE